MINVDGDREIMEQEHLVRKLFITSLASLGAFLGLQDGPWGVSITLSLERTLQSLAT